MLQNEKIKDTIKWMDIYLSRYSFDFKYLIPDETLLLDSENFDTIFFDKEYIERAIVTFDNQDSISDSRRDLDSLIKETGSSVGLKKLMPEKIEKIKRMDKIVYGLLKRLSAHDARFKVFVEDWNNFIKRMDTI